MIYPPDGPGIAFAANDSLWTFTDQDRREDFEAARDAVGFDAALAAIRGAAGFDTLGQDAADLLVRLDTAWREFAPEGATGASALRAVVTTLETGDDGDGADTPAAAAMAFTGVAALVTAVRAALDASVGLGTVDPDELQALTVYVAPDGADGPWRASAIPTADIGELENTPHYVIATTDGTGAVTMNGLRDGPGSLWSGQLTYAVTTAPVAIRHVINIANRDDNAPEFQLPAGGRTPGADDIATTIRTVAPTGFTGWHMVRNDGDAANGDGASFAYDAAIWGDGPVPVPVKEADGETDTALDRDLIDDADGDGTANNDSTLRYAVTLQPGHVYMSQYGPDHPPARMTGCR